MILTEEQIGEFATQMVEFFLPKIQEKSPINRKKKKSESEHAWTSVELDDELEFLRFQAAELDIKAQIHKQLSEKLPDWGQIEVEISTQTVPHKNFLPITDRDFEELELQTYGRALITIKLFAK